MTDKEKAIEKLKNFADHCYPNEEFLMAIKALEQEPNKGHWIRKENEFFVPSRFYPIKEIVSTCSICNARYLGEQKGYKYCPNCGAKMVESED